jgi:excisionase family DNA binding protein
MTQHQAGRAVESPAQQRQEPGDLLTDRPVDRLAYSVKEAAEATGLSRDLLYDEMRAGRLAYLKVGRRRIITRQQLQAFLTQGPA